MIEPSRPDIYSLVVNVLIAMKFARLASEFVENSTENG